MFTIAAMLFALLLLPTRAGAKTLDSGSCGDNLSWELNDQGVLTISGTGDMKDYPGGVGFNSPWSRNNQIVQVVIQPGVTSVGQKAFYGCKNIQSISLPEGLRKIGSAAFIFNESLQAIHIPTSVTEIDDSAFTGCTSLTTLTVAAGNANYTASAQVLFNKDMTELIYCANGKTGAYQIPQTVQSLGYWAFGECAALTSISIPDTVTSIGDLAFYECASLKSIKIPYGITEIPKYAFYNCVSLASIDIPNTVTSIHEFAFEGCTSLTALPACAGVWYIDRFAFSGCTGLTELDLPDSLVKLRGYTFYNCTGLTAVHLPAELDCVSGTDFLGCTRLATITCPEANPYLECRDGVLFQKTLLGKPCHYLRCCPPQRTGEYAVPDDITSIDEYAFAYSNLSKITIPASVMYIGEGAFSDMSQLKAIRIPATVTSIGAGAFSGTDCVIDVADGSAAQIYAVDHDLKYTVDGQSVEPEPEWTGSGYTIRCRPDGTAMITDCTLTGDIRIPAELNGYTIDSLDGRLFYGKYGIYSISIPATVTFFGTDRNDDDWDYVFSYCYDLQSIEVDPGNPAFCSRDGVLFSKDEYTLIQYPCDRPGAVFHLSEATDFICCTSFASAKNLRHLFLESKDAEWMGYAFYNDPDLTVHYIAGGRSETRYGINGSYCNFVVYQPGAQHAHVPFAQAAIPPTWTTPGLTQETYCSVCGALMAQGKRIPALEELSVLVLPEDLLVVEEEAFAGLTCQAIIVPKGCETIEGRAFANCKNLLYIQIPSGTKLAKTALEGCSEDVLIDRAVK